MNMPKDMRTDYDTLLSRLILDKDDNAPSRSRVQENALKDLQCTDAKFLGRWIDGCDFPFLIETLLLDVAIFSEEFPNVRLTAEERKEFANALEAHCETCQLCHRKKMEDLAWQSCVERAFVEDKQAIVRAIARAAGKK